MHEHAQNMAVIMMAEQGKPLAESLSAISYGSAFLN
jgi:acyl-CoA reductase-like NAD-dependent aldehyde dehydrogenase